MERTKHAIRIINTSDIYCENDFFKIKGIIHSYKLYDCDVNEDNELTFTIRHTSIVRNHINEAIVTCHKDGTSTLILNRYEF